ncbi:MAG: cache domain-containing protein, partial [Arcobacteraceae bacterium]|nr:cache domain-containing protein [Arcobacteraceae bacterium]
MINFRIKIRPTVLFVFALLVGIAVLTTLGIQYYFSKKLAFASIEESVQHISEKTQQKIESFNKSNYDLLSVLQYSHTLLQHPKEEQNFEFLKTFTTAISNNPYVYALYIGFENGDFYEVINLDIDDSLRVKFSASNKEKWFVVKIFKHHSTPIRLEQFLDKNFHIVRSVQKKVDYNPTLRTWYQKALTSQEAVVTAPYSFANLDGMGVTYAQKIEQTNNVLGLDVSLRSFSSFLEAQKIVQKSHLYIFDQHNRVIASNISDEKAYFKNIDSILAQSLKNNDNTMTINHEEYFVSHYYLNSKSNSYLSIFVPEYEILKPFNEKINQGEDEKSVKQWLEKEQQTLQEEFEFIANANKGGEFMSQEDQEKIKEIAQRQWKAYFDDALGLSHDEQVRYVKNESKVEHLLDNKPHHLIPRSPKSVSDYDKYGFKVDI